MDIPPALITQFIGITQAAESHARQLLTDSRLDLDAAISSFFAIQEAGGLPAPSAEPNAPPSAAAAPPSPPPPEDDVRAPIPGTIDQLLTNAPRRSQAVRDPFVHGNSGDPPPNVLSSLFRAPEHLIFHGDLDAAMATGRDAERWILVAIHNADEFACHVLNRDVWSDGRIQELLTGAYVFWQRNAKADDARRYRQFYPYASEPHVAILDPRSGERVVVFEGTDAFTQRGMLAAMTEFVATNSLKDAAAPARAGTGGNRPPVDSFGMSEDDQLAAAIAASMEGVEQPPPAKEAPKEPVPPMSNGGPAAATTAKPMEKMEKPQPQDHKPKQETKRARAPVPTEPPAGSPGVTELMIRLPNGGRLQRRFQETDTLAGVAAFVDANAEGLPGEDYDLVTPFPRKVFSDLGLTLADAGISGRAVVMVHLR